MADVSDRPIDVARRLARRRDRFMQQRETEEAEAADVGPEPAFTRLLLSTWRRETFTMPRQEAHEKAREWLDRFPRAAYLSEVESWRELSDGQVELTLRRLPSAA